MPGRRSGTRRGTHSSWNTAVSRQAGDDNPDVWVNTMMTEELGYGRDASNPLRAAATIFVALVVVGFLPLAAFVHDLAAPG